MLKLNDTFIVPPFSVLDTKQGYWQKRKKYWLSIGLKSEIGRGQNQECDENTKYGQQQTIDMF